MTETCFLAGSPYHMESVQGLDLCERASRGVLTHLLLNQPPICDCRCRRCFMPEARRGECKNGLTLDEYRGVIHDAAAAGIRCLEISGEGEPLLSENIRGVVGCAHDCGLVTTLITNGHVLSDDFVSYAFEHNVTLVVSMFSLNKNMYEMDNSLPGSFDETLAQTRRAAQVYRHGTKIVDGKRVYRMAIHTTVQSDNFGEIGAIRSFCEECGIFFSVAPLAPVGGGADLIRLGLGGQKRSGAGTLGHNSIILSHTSSREVGREVCGTCLYGLNIGYDGNVLFDAHAGYEVGGMLGNVRKHSIKELIRRQRRFAPLLFSRIDGFCPVRDPKWPEFLRSALSSPISWA